MAQLQRAMYGRRPSPAREFKIRDGAAPMTYTRGGHALSKIECALPGRGTAGQQRIPFCRLAGSRFYPYLSEPAGPPPDWVLRFGWALLSPQRFWVDKTLEPREHGLPMRWSLRLLQLPVVRYRLSIPLIDRNRNAQNRTLSELRVFLRLSVPPRLNSRHPPFQFPPSMNDDVSRRGCSLETHRSSLTLAVVFLASVSRENRSAFTRL
jgi:hypothetical protein